MMRQTIAKPIEFRGIGLHGGQIANLQISPAPAGSGILFMRSDVSPEQARLPARFDLVGDTRLCTKLVNGHGVSVSTIEHVMAALAGTGIHDAVLRVDGPEVPILDGSSAPFVAGIRRAGLRQSTVPLEAIRILQPVEVTSKGRVARLLPAARTEIGFEIEFDDPAIGTQSGEFVLEGAAFAAEIADCRTFCMLAEVEGLRQMGLARGGGLENAIVVDKGRVLNPEGLRRPDEFVRHKILDAIGDLSLAGAPIIGRYEGVRAGHEMTNLLLHALFAKPAAWEWTTMEPASRPGSAVAARKPDAAAALAV